MTTVYRVGFLQVLGSKFRDDTKPYSSHVIEVIDGFLPPMAISRNEKLQETMRVMKVKIFMNLSVFRKYLL
jgi:hypothetical protein